MTPNLQLPIEDDELFENMEMYKRLTSILNYLRDACSVSIVSQFMHSPPVIHSIAVE